MNGKNLKMYSDIVPVDESWKTNSQSVTAASSAESPTKITRSRGEMAAVKSDDAIYRHSLWTGNRVDRPPGFHGKRHAFQILAAN
jgi:hypothetical protein